MTCDEFWAKTGYVKFEHLNKQDRRALADHMRSCTECFAKAAAIAHKVLARKTAEEVAKMRKDAAELVARDQQVVPEPSDN